MEKYYKLSSGTTGRILASYARPQPDIPGLIKLEEPTFEPATWNGSSWAEDVETYGQQKIIEIRTLLYTEWPDSSKTIAALKAQYDVVKSSASGWTSFADVDAAYNNWVTFMDLS